MLLRNLGVLLAVSVAAYAADGAGSSRFIITNDDGGATSPNSVTFYSLSASGSPTNKTVVQTGGAGIGGGFFAEERALVVSSGSSTCVFASDAGSGDVASILLSTQTLVGDYPGSNTDSGVANGIGLASNGKYLYASFSSSSTIATYQIQGSCALNFLGDVFTVGLNSGLVGGMTVQGNLMVVSYGDGSIESFDVSGGEPTSHGDAQYSGGSTKDHFPNGVDITQDGRFALFGDASTVSTIEVSDISAGALTPSVAYNTGSGWNSGKVRLSPDESVVYVSNDSGGQVTAAFFDKTTGVVTQGCTSLPLNGFYTNFAYVGGVKTQLTTGTGGLIYVPEFGLNGTSYVGVLQLTVSGGGCTLLETATSPISDRNANLLSIQVYPNRPF